MLNKIGISLRNDGTAEYLPNKSTRNKRDGKGKYTVNLTGDYIMLDVETTGLNPEYDDLIEIGLLKVSNNKVVDEFSCLIKYDDYEIPYHIEYLTGITTKDMNQHGIYLDEALNKAYEFIGEHFILGYNTAFDINFMYDAFAKIGKTFSNDYFDILQLARKIEPNKPGHRLKDMCDYYSIERPSHRALDDCHKTKFVYDTLLEKHAVNPAVWSTAKLNKNSELTSLRPRVEIVDDSNPFFGKYVCFTGKLTHFLNRTEAMQVIVDLGGIPQSGVTKDTNYLIIGETEFIQSITDGKTAKMKKANTLKSKGQDIEILNEELFIDSLVDYVEIQ